MACDCSILVSESNRVGKAIPSIPPRKGSRLVLRSHEAR
jgi:hypothetical protein